MYGKNKQQLKDYRAETLGYGNLTFLKKGFVKIAGKVKEWII